MVAASAAAVFWRTLLGRHVKLPGPSGAHNPYRLVFCTPCQHGWLATTIGRGWVGAFIQTKLSHSGPGLNYWPFVLKCLDKCALAGHCCPVTLTPARPPAGLLLFSPPFVRPPCLCCSACPLLPIRLLTPTPPPLAVAGAAHRFAGPAAGRRGGVLLAAADDFAVGGHVVEAVLAGLPKRLEALGLAVGFDALDAVFAGGFGSVAFAELHDFAVVGAQTVPVLAAALEDLEGCHDGKMKVVRLMMMR